MGKEKEKKSTRLYLMRHGSTGSELAGRMVGASDVPLGAEGPAQVRRTASRLARLSFAAFYASPMRRVRQSAGILREELALGEPVIINDLREVDFGRWERLNFVEISARDPEMAVRWSVWSPDFVFPEGEKVGDFIARVKKTGNELLRSGGNVLVVAHGGVIRALVCHFLGLEPSRYLLFDVKPAAMVVMEVFANGLGSINFE